MKLLNIKQSLLILTMSVSSLAAIADNAQALISELQTSWDQSYFTLDNRPQKKALRALIEKAEILRLKHADIAEFYIWEGIIRASYNEAAGGIGGLRQANKAKDLFEKALSINPDALHGLAHIELGALYYRVPGWPISFGDDAKAKELLVKGLSKNPLDLEAHYLLGKFYIEEDDWQAAATILEKGLSLPEIVERPAFDQARRDEMQVLLSTAKKNLAP